MFQWFFTYPTIGGIFFRDERLAREIFVLLFNTANSFCYGFQRLNKFFHDLRSCQTFKLKRFSLFLSHKQNCIATRFMYFYCSCFWVGWVVLTSWDMFNDWLQVKGQQLEQTNGTETFCSKTLCFLAFARLLVCSSSKVLNVFRIVPLRCKHENSFYKFGYLLSLLIPWRYQ